MFTALISLVLRLVLGAATVVLVLGLMVLALAILLVVGLWSLVRGRKPVLEVPGFARVWAFRAGRGFARGPARRAPPADVVDIEARVVGEAHESASRPTLPPQAH
ncbi:hypothetical protein ACS5PK_02275 [Roseateles sp. DB2]|uniref:hypothetical protein n=1 Tax=Roseateles sp. DB2 TaxID=3453717 RepID=UPI003EED99A5